MWRVPTDTERDGKAADRSLRPARDTTDYEHRHFVNLCATAFLLALGLCIGWTIKAFDEHQKLERCVLSGRKDCVEVVHRPPRGTIEIPRLASR